MTPVLSRIAIAATLALGLSPVVSAETYEFRTLMKGMKAAASCVSVSDIPLQATQVRSDICGFVGQELYQSLDGTWFKGSEDTISTLPEALATCVPPFALPRLAEARDILRTKGMLNQYAHALTSSNTTRMVQWTGGTNYRAVVGSVPRVYQYCKAVF